MEDKVVLTIHILRKIIFGLLMPILLSSESLASSGWLIFYEKAFEGRVVNLDTKEPIEGAVVVAIYHVRMFGPILPIFSGSEIADIQETLTDSHGFFFIPSNIFFYPWPTTLGGETTVFIIFKPGYGSLKMALGKYLTGATAEVYEMELSGKKYRLSTGLIELPPLKTREERKMAKPAPIGDKKDWKKQRQFIKQIREEWEYLTGKPAGDLYKIEED